MTNGTGLVYQRENGSYVERYAGRVIFPWHNISSRVIAFGARVLDSRSNGIVKKYVNSSDSCIYTKGKELYGLFQAKRSIAEEEMVYVVEGYMDVISMHQYGIKNVVANSGTTMTIAQAQLLKRFTKNATLMYDSDSAGIKAIIRSINILLSEDMNVYVVTLPDGEDPDSFCQGHSEEDLKTFFANHRQTFAEFMTHAMLDGVNDPVLQSEAVHCILNCINKIQDPIKRALFIKHLAKVSGLDEKLLA